MPAGQGRSARRGRPHAAWATELAEGVRSNSTTHRERARQPCERPRTAIECPICYRPSMGLLQALSRTANLALVADTQGGVACRADSLNRPVRCRICESIANVGFRQ